MPYRGWLTAVKPLVGSFESALIGHTLLVCSGTGVNRLTLDLRERLRNHWHHTVGGDGGSRPRHSSDPDDRPCHCGTCLRNSHGLSNARDDRWNRLRGIGRWRHTGDGVGVAPRCVSITRSTSLDTDASQGFWLAHGRGLSMRRKEGEKFSDGCEWSWRTSPTTQQIVLPNLTSGDALLKIAQTEVDDPLTEASDHHPLVGAEPRRLGWVNAELEAALGATNRGAALGYQRVIELVLRSTSSATNVHEDSLGKMARPGTHHTSLRQGVRIFVDCSRRRPLGQPAGPPLVLVSALRYTRAVPRGPMARSNAGSLSGGAIVALWCFVLFGCSHDSSTMTCYRNSDCGVGYECNTATGVCERAEASCARPSDCALEHNETCGEDGRCAIGSCRLLGCVSGFLCAIGTEGSWECQDASKQPTDGGAAGAAGSASAGMAGGEAAAAGAADGGADENAVAGASSVAGSAT